MTAHFFLAPDEGAEVVLIDMTFEGTLNLSMLAIL